MRSDDGETQASSDGVRSVHRAIDILELFDDAHPTRTLRDLTQATGLPKTTVVRLISTLERRGLLDSRSDGSIALGVVFLQWVNLIPRLRPVSEAVREIMAEVAAATGETTNLYVRQGTSRVCIAQQQGPASVRHVISVGAPMHLWAGAASKVLLGDPALPQDVIAAVAEQSPYGPEFATSLRGQAHAAAELGHAISHGERELGASGVAAPVFADGRVVAALAIGGPTTRFNAERLAGYVAAVTTAAKRVSELGLG